MPVLCSHHHTFLTCALQLNIRHLRFHYLTSPFCLSQNAPITSWASAAAQRPVLVPQWQTAAAAAAAQPTVQRHLVAAAAAESLHAAAPPPADTWRRSLMEQADQQQAVIPVVSSYTLTLEVLVTTIDALGHY